MHCIALHCIDPLHPLHPLHPGSTNFLLLAQAIWDRRAATGKGWEFLAWMKGMKGINTDAGAAEADDSLQRNDQRFLNHGKGKGKGKGNNGAANALAT